MSLLPTAVTKIKLNKMAAMENQCWTNSVQLTDCHKTTDM